MQTLKINFDTPKQFELSNIKPLNGIVGLFAGFGGGFFVTNACTATGLKGPMSNYSINVGIGYNFGIQ